VYRGVSEPTKLLHGSSDRWQPMQAQVLDAGALSDKRISDSAYRVYQAINRLSASAGHCWASYQYLAGVVGRARRTVIRAVQKLEELGYLLVDRCRTRGNGSQTTNHFVPAWRVRSGGVTDVTPGACGRSQEKEKRAASPPARADHVEDALVQLERAVPMQDEDRGDRARERYALRKALRTNRLRFIVAQCAAYYSTHMRFHLPLSAFLATGTYERWTPFERRRHRKRAPAQFANADPNRRSHWLDALGRELTSALPPASLHEGAGWVGLAFASESDVAAAAGLLAIHRHALPAGVAVYLAAAGDARWRRPSDLTCR